MILAVDPGYAKCGWALVDPSTGRPTELGVIVTHPHADVFCSVKVPGKKKRQRIGSIPQSVDRARRMRVVSRRLRDLIAGKPITAIAVEQMLSFGPAAAVSANILPWGAMTMLADFLDVPLAEVVSMIWQHGVLGTDLLATTKPPKVDRKKLERRMVAFIGRHAGTQLEAIASDLRNHAIDAVGVGMLAALSPGDASWIVNNRAET